MRFNRSSSALSLTLVLTLLLTIVPINYVHAENIKADLGSDITSNGAILPLVSLESLPNPHIACKPLLEARSVLQELQPTVYAHLEKKLGGTLPSIGSKGWGESLGWGHEVYLSF
jgi:hypothetical protein